VGNGVVGAGLLFRGILAVVTVVVPVMIVMISVMILTAIPAVIIASTAAVFSVFEFEQILDVVFQHEQIGSVCSMELDATAVVPLDAASQLFAVLKHHHHRGPVVHLFLVIEALGVSLFRGHTLSIRIVLIATMLIVAIAIATFAYFRKCRSY
jgi:hypothetical protein